MIYKGFITVPGSWIIVIMIIIFLISFYLTLPFSHTDMFCFLNTGSVFYAASYAASYALGFLPFNNFFSHVFPAPSVCLAFHPQYSPGQFLS